MTRSLQRLALTVVWLLIVAIVSVGGAGLVAAMGNLPGTPARAELTETGDATVAAALDKVQLELTDLTTDVERLGELGRGALTAMVSSDFTTLDKAVADGEVLARAIETRSAQIREELQVLPGSGPHEALVWSLETSHRRDLALTAVQATGGLEIAWARLAAGSSVATRLTGLLTNHDTTAGKAAATGRNRQYAAALKTLAEAQAMLDQAKKLRDALANTVDVSTLTQWIDRNVEYDTALARLYQATIDAKGKITQKLRDAFNAERRAHDFLPSNTSGLVIILAEIGRGGLNQAVIGNEETRAKHQEAVDRLRTPAGADVSNLAQPSTPGG
ncbi:MAG: hypothetical protein QOD73_2165 [Solirubrobacteraceae bacterium]|nr:hypothetical protein [Solirubrobacteraceae bacterium]